MFHPIRGLRDSRRGSRHRGTRNRARSRRRRGDGRFLRRDRRQRARQGRRRGLTGALTDAGVPAPLAGKLGEAKDAFAMGATPFSDDMPAQVKAAVVEGSHTAVMNGVHTTVLVTGVLTVIGAVAAAVGVRGRSAGGAEQADR